MSDERTYTAFAGDERIASGPLRDTLRRTLERLDRDAESGGGEPVLIFEDATGKQVDFDLRGTLEDVLEREAPPPPRRGPGRPRLGVVSREISLLPRHWEWLERQPNGASAALRRLVDAARKGEGDEARARRAADAAGRFMTSMAGNRPHFEEAYRSLYAGERARFEDLVRDWPDDVREHARRLAEDAFPPNDEGEA